MPDWLFVLEFLGLDAAICYNARAFLRVFLVLSDWCKIAIARLDSDIIPIVLAHQGRAGIIKCLIVIDHF